jgi:hypothetical protein
MRNYLELFREGFPSDMSDRTAIENWPYVGHDVITGEVVYSDLAGPAVVDYIYYTTADGAVLNIHTKEWYEDKYFYVPVVLD